MRRFVLWLSRHPVIVFLTEFHLRFYRVRHRRKFAYWIYHTEAGKWYFGISWLGWNLESVGYFYPQNDATHATRPADGGSNSKTN